MFDHLLPPPPADGHDDLATFEVRMLAASLEGAFRIFQIVRQRSPERATACRREIEKRLAELDAG